jgi:hypothetical protein
VRTQATSLAGAFAADLDASPGDSLALSPGFDLQPPPPPAGFSAELTSNSCVRLTWLPGGDPTVVGYVVSFGKKSVSLGHAARYDHTVDAGSAAQRTICQLVPARYYFAVQSRNYYGQLSAYSVERTVIVSTVPVLISSFEARAEGRGVSLSWHVIADEVVRGFRVYRSEAKAPALSLFDAPLPPDAVSYLDEGTRSATSYTYVLVTLKEDGSEVRSLPATVITPTLALALGPNVPNPFHASTRISFTLARPSRVMMQIYDVRGARVATLLEGAQGEGSHTIDWEGVDDAGRPVASGTYFCTLTAGRETVSRKISVLR